MTKHPFDHKYIKNGLLFALYCIIMLRRMLESIRFYLALIDGVLVIQYASSKVLLFLSSFVSALSVIALFIFSGYVSKFHKFPSSMLDHTY